MQPQTKLLVAFALAGIMLCFLAIIMLICACVCSCRARHRRRNEEGKVGKASQSPKVTMKVATNDGSKAKYSRQLSMVDDDLLEDELSERGNALEPTRAACAPRAIVVAEKPAIIIDPDL